MPLDLLQSYQSISMSILSVSISNYLASILYKYKHKYLPKNDATIKYKYGIPTNGEPKFTNQFGINGVNLKNIMYQNKLFSFALIIELNF